MKPCVVGEPSVLNMRIGKDEKFKRAIRGLLNLRFRVWSNRWQSSKWIGGFRDHSVVQRSAPELFKVIAGMLDLPETADDFITAREHITTQRGVKFVRGFAVVERLDERLYNCRRAVEGSRVASGF